MQAVYYYRSAICYVIVRSMRNVCKASALTLAVLNSVKLTLLVDVCLSLSKLLFGRIKQVWRAAQARAHVAATQAAQQPMLWGRRGSCIDNAAAATTVATAASAAGTAAAAALLDSTDDTAAAVTNSTATASTLAVAPPSIALLGAPGGSEQSPTGGAGSLHKLFSIELHQLQVQLHDDEVSLHSINTIALTY
jgi:hypothetical protein